MRRNVILDTCALIWLVSGDAKLTADTKRRIDAAASVFVSAISAWETSLLVAREQLALPREPLDWFMDAVEHHDLTVASLTPRVLVHANGLPWHHRDPADRFIIATAILKELTVVTADHRFADYGIDIIL